jgi:hypothetical protein
MISWTSWMFPHLGLARPRGFTFAASRVTWAVSTYQVEDATLPRHIPGTSQLRSLWRGPGHGGGWSGRAAQVPV